MIPKQHQDEYGYNYESLWKVIIRPPKAKYDMTDLNQASFQFKSKMYIRTDYTLLSFQGYFIKASFIQPDEAYRPSPTMPVVIYLHGNSSSRVEGYNNKRFLLANDINMFIFDFPGCGNSEGDYISLGYHEQKDMRIICNFVARLPGVGKIGLWGRSMGAATSLLYAPLDDRIQCVCADSPFADFTRLAKEIVARTVKAPNFAVDGVLKILAKTIKTKNGMDIHNVRPIDSVINTKIPGMFIHGMQDELIDFQHSIDLCESYGGMKYMRPCLGGHNSIRPEIITDDIQRFFVEFLKGKSNKENKKENDDFNGIMELKMYDNNGQIRLFNGSNGKMIDDKENKKMEHLLGEPKQAEEEYKSIMQKLTLMPDNNNNKSLKDYENQPSQLDNPDQILDDLDQMTNLFQDSSSFSNKDKSTNQVVTINNTNKNDCNEMINQFDDLTSFIDNIVQNVEESK